MNDNEILERADQIKKEKAIENKRAYIREYDKKNSINKTIKFNRFHDADIIEYIEELDKPFSALVKELIREKIKENRG